MTEDVVAGFMAEDEEDFVRGELLNGGVPDDDAFGMAKTFDIGVKGGEFGGGLHEEHAVGRDVHAATMGDLFQAFDKGGLASCELFVVKEERLNVRPDEETKEGDWDREAPEDEPPAVRKFANDPEKQHEDQAADQPLQQEGFCLVSEPAAPALDGEPVAERGAVAVEIQREVEERAG